MPKKIEIAATQTIEGSRYPAPYDEPCKGRFRRILGDAAGLTQFGVTFTRLPPGSWSSQRHWHTAEDEFVFVVEGTVILVTDSGEEVLNAGDCAGFRAGSAGPPPAEPLGQGRTDSGSRHTASRGRRSILIQTSIFMP